MAKYQLRKRHILFDHFNDYRTRIKDILSRSIYYLAKKKEMFLLAKKISFNGVFFDVYPNTGGFDLKTKHIKTKFRKPGFKKLNYN